jgi:hypothetical protein
MDVNGDVTPISNEPVAQVEASDWHIMPIQQLEEQLFTLTNRQYAVQQMKRPDIARQMNDGIEYLRQLIAYKQSERAKNDIRSSETIG